MQIYVDIQYFMLYNHCIERKQINSQALRTKTEQEIKMRMTIKEKLIDRGLKGMENQTESVANQNLKI